MKGCHAKLGKKWASPGAKTGMDSETQNHNNMNYKNTMNVASVNTASRQTQHKPGLDYDTHHKAEGRTDCMSSGPMAYQPGNSVARTAQRPLRTHECVSICRLISMYNGSDSNT